MKLFFVLCCVHLVASEEDLIAAATKDQFTTKDADFNQIKNGLQTLFTFGLLGGAMALVSPKRQQDLQGVDRQGYYYDQHYEDPRLSYAQRVNQFENKLYDRFAGTFRTLGTNARHATKKIRNAMRRTGHRSLGVVRLGANSIARLASATDRNLRGMARTATRGLRKISSRMNRVGSGSIERMGSIPTNVGTAAIRGLYKVSKAYMNGLDKAGSAAFRGLRRMGTTYRRGISRVGQVASGLASAYSRGVSRMGEATPALPSFSDGVDRLGELASQVSDAALSVPKSLANNVAKDQKMRACLLQAMCYVSTPFIDPNSNYVKRSVQLLQEESDGENDEELLVDLATQLNGGNNKPLRIEDCEAFKCEVVSFGKKAYELVSKLSNEEE